jgi:hypothetical protein
VNPPSIIHHLNNEPYEELDWGKYANALYSNLVFLKYPTYFSSFCLAVMKIIVYMLITRFVLLSSHQIIVTDKNFSFESLSLLFQIAIGFKVIIVMK